MQLDVSVCQLEVEVEVGVDFKYTSCSWLPVASTGYGDDPGMIGSRFIRGNTSEKWGN